MDIVITQTAVRVKVSNSTALAAVCVFSTAVPVCMKKTWRSLTTIVSQVIDFELTYHPRRPHGLLS